MHVGAQIKRRKILALTGPETGESSRSLLIDGEVIHCRRGDVAYASVRDSMIFIYPGSIADLKCRISIKKAGPND